MTRCTRSRAPSLVSRCPTCVFVVAGVMSSRLAISVLDRPPATRASTSRSRAVITSSAPPPARAGGAERRGPGDPLAQPPGHAGGEQGVARRDDLDRVQQLGG